LPQARKELLGKGLDAIPCKGGVAIPHARLEGLQRPCAVLGLHHRGFAVHGQLVQFVALILSPLEETELHLQLLSEAEAMLADSGLRHALRRAASPAAALAILQRYQQGISGRETYCPLPSSEVFQELGSSPYGLEENAAQKLLARFGPNLIIKAKGRPLIIRFAANLTSPFALLLWTGGILAFFAGMPELGWAIFAVVLVNAVFSFWQEFKAEKAVESLRLLLPQRARVIRGGSLKEIAAPGLVPGDVIMLEEGDSVPADARLIESFNIRVDNSALTGESRPIYKTAETVRDHKAHLWTEMPNLVFAGTSVLSGSGKAVVMATGMHSEIGRIASLTQGMTQGKSPLQRELERVTGFLSILAVLMGVVFFFLGRSFGDLGISAAFLFAIGIIVANVPEGLLPTVTLALAMAVQRMARRNAMVKRLASVETLGTTTVICTDKTGTLTTGEVNVVKIWTTDHEIEVELSGAGPYFTIAGSPMPDALFNAPGLRRLLDCATLCSNASLRPPQTQGGAWTRLGDPTESALLLMASSAGVDIGNRRFMAPRTGLLPFDAVRKRMASVHRLEGLAMAFVKGAPAETLTLCARVMLGDQEVALSPELRERIVKATDKMAASGLRVLALACRSLARGTAINGEEIERDLVFLGITAMMDPPRPEVPEAVAMCRRAGIRVVMMTGDYGLTALSIARRIGLTALEHEARIVTGPELDELNHAALKELLAGDEVIFARVNPEHKLRVVEAFQELGEVVAMTGDGVNDAPALKKADIGVAMGGRGSDVAREAAAMILADDNFSSIVAAVEEGRAVYANIRKFVSYILASNVPEIVPFVLFILCRIPLPLTIMQILAVDLGTDLLPALALGAERPEPGVMDEPPRKRSERLLNLPLLLRAYGFLGIIEAACAMAGFFAVYWMAGWRPGQVMAEGGPLYLAATTMTLAAIVACQVGNVLACRSERQSLFRLNLTGNPLIWWGIAAELLLVTALILFPATRQAFGLAPLEARHLAILPFFPLLLLIAEEIRKKIMRKKILGSEL